MGSQGSANVSHGCVGLSTPDARWLHERTRRGDVVVVRGSKRRITVENGWGDWSVPFREYRGGSALS
ncbi:MAG: L,D-transpeptidase family protein [Nocardioides sp.]|nr:L,D-transpeptidase family protein [Nocardioides sp.]